MAKGATTNRRRRSSRPAAVAAAIAVAVAATACGAGEGSGPPTINLYYAPEENLHQVVDACNAQAQGRYRISYQVLPRGADDQRTQMVRRLAAQDDGMDVLGLDVTWTPEFASAKEHQYPAVVVPQGSRRTSSADLG